MTAPQFLLGRKVGMTQVYRGDGECVPVTVVSAGPCVVAQVKTQETDGYQALQLAFDSVRENALTRPRLGHLKKAGFQATRAGDKQPARLTGKVLREVRLDGPSDLKVGDEIKADVFQPGQRIDVIGTVKGRGFQGTMRAHNFAGKPRTHGNMNQRGPGAIGMHSQPGETLKGKAMATHWGDERCTVRNLEVVEVDAENNALLIRGAVPGPRGSLVIVRKAVAWREPKQS